MKRLIVVALLLASGWAAAQSPDAAMTVPESECYTCHKAGGSGGGIPLVRMMNVSLDPSMALTPGTPTQLGVIVSNRWSASLENIEVTLDIARAPSLAFSGRPPPILDQNASITFPSFFDDPMAEGRSGSASFEIPTGGTDLRITVVPDTTDGPEAPDFAIQIWPPGILRDDASGVVIDAAGSGGGEERSFQGDPVPSGEWTVAVHQGGWPDAPTDRSRIADQAFTLAWDLWFNVSETDPIRHASAEVDIDGRNEDAPQNTTISWPITLLDPLTGSEAIHVRVEADAYHDHAAQSRAGDRQRFWREAVFFIQPPPEPEAPATVAPPEPAAPAPEAEAPAYPWYAVGEILGYAAAFLVALSLVTGGAFGQWSRNVQNWLARSARRRRLNHVLTGYGILLVAIGHAVLFVLEPRFGWSVGWLFGGGAIIAMVLLGLTGMLQVPMTRRFGAEGWRWLHFIAAVLCVATVVLHIALDGIHFVDFQRDMAWQDPLVPVMEAWFEAPVTNGTAAP